MNGTIEATYADEKNKVQPSKYYTTQDTIMLTMHEQMRQRGISSLLTSKYGCPCG